MTAAAGTTIFAQANPPFVAANGGVSVVTAVLTEPAGTFVPDGTVVFFFTDLGHIDPQAKTKDGVANVNFVSDSRSGIANILVQSGGPAVAASAASPTPTPAADLPLADSASGTGSLTLHITIGSALPDHLLVGADPQRLVGPGSSAIVANVFDPSGNPVANVPVFFSITSDTTSQTLDSGGNPRFTDTNGQAFDTFRNRVAAGTTAVGVTVTATTANNKSSPVTVTVFELVPTPAPTATP
jgi:hypothetical protein